VTGGVKLRFVTASARGGIRSRPRTRYLPCLISPSIIYLVTIEERFYTYGTCPVAHGITETCAY
jgi:hypothetical protein